MLKDVEETKIKKKEMKQKKIKKEQKGKINIKCIRSVSFQTILYLSRARKKKTILVAAIHLIVCLLFMCTSSSKRLHTGYIQQTVIVFTWPLKSVRTLNNTMKLKTCSDRSLCVSFPFFSVCEQLLWCGWQVLQKKRLSLMLCGSSDFICRFLLMVTLAFSCGYPHRHFNIDAILGFKALYRPTTFTLLIHYWVVEVTVRHFMRLGHDSWNLKWWLK